MKSTILSVVAVIILIGGAMMFSRGGVSGENTNTTVPNNVSIVDGKQIVEIKVKGGYFPRTINAKANMPTVIKFKTSGTFDCSLAVSIPGIGYRANLPSSGETLVDISSQKAGSKLRGSCAMGMYGFEINFN